MCCSFKMQGDSGVNPRANVAKPIAAMSTIQFTGPRMAVNATKLKGLGSGRASLKKGKKAALGKMKRTMTA